MQSILYTTLSLVALLWLPLPSSANRYRELSTKQAKKNPHLVFQYAEILYTGHKDPSTLVRTHEGDNCTATARAGMGFAHLQLMFENRDNASWEKYLERHRYFLLPMYQEVIHQLNPVNETSSPFHPCSVKVAINDSFFEPLVCVQIQGQKERACKWCKDAPFRNDTEKNATARLCKVRGKNGKVLDLDSTLLIPSLVKSKSGSSRSKDLVGWTSGFIALCVMLVMNIQ